GTCNGKVRAGSRFGIHEVREVRLLAGSLVDERQRAPVRGQGRRKTFAVALRLDLDARQGPAFLLRLDGAGRGSRDVQAVVHGPGRGGEFADGNSQACRQIRRRPVLDQPAGSFELAVDLLAGRLLGLASRHGVDEVSPGDGSRPPIAEVRTTPRGWTTATALAARPGRGHGPARRPRRPPG